LTSRQLDILSQHLLNVWHSVEQHVIDTSTDEWHARHNACIRADGGYFEQMF